MPDFGERGAPDYRKTACLTIEEFERIVARCIVYYNSERVISDYPYTAEMIQKKIRPYACDIWAYKVQQPGTNLISVTEKEIALSLLPRTEGKFTRYGLMVNKLRYHRDGYKEAYLKGGICVVSYNPDDVSSVWVRTDECSYEEFKPSRVSITRVERELDICHKRVPDRTVRRTAAHRRMGPAAPAVSPSASKGAVHRATDHRQTERLSGRSERAGRGHVS